MIHCSNYQYKNHTKKQRQQYFVLKPKNYKALGLFTPTAPTTHRTIRFQVAHIHHQLSVHQNPSVFLNLYQFNLTWVSENRTLAYPNDL